MIFNSSYLISSYLYLGNYENLNLYSVFGVQCFRKVVFIQSLS